jgi:hypothetical protein
MAPSLNHAVVITRAAKCTRENTTRVCTYVHEDVEPDLWRVSCAPSTNTVAPIPVAPIPVAPISVAPNPLPQYPSPLCPLPLYPLPCTLYPAPCTLHPAPYTLHPALCTLHCVPCIVHPALCTLHCAPCTLYPAPCTLHPAPYAVSFKPCTRAHLGPALDDLAGREGNGLAAFVAAVEHGAVQQLTFVVAAARGPRAGSGTHRASPRSAPGFRV